MEKILHLIRRGVTKVPSRMWGLYLLAFLVLWPFTNFDQALMEARSSALSRVIPNFDYLIQFRDGKVPFDREKMQTYLDYFLKVDAYLPDKADVLSLLGYCTYYLGRDEDAILYYRRALLSFSKPFAAHYNLGALYFKQGQYPLAIEKLRDALKNDFIQNISFVSSSRIYFPLIKDPRKIDVELSEYMKVAYERCYRLLVASYAAVGESPNEFYFSVKALEHPVQDPAFFNYHAGLSAAKMKKNPEAAKFLTAYLKEKPDRPTVLYHLGMTFLEMGHQKIGAAMLANAEQLKKDDKSDDEPAGKIDLQLY